MKDQPLWTQFFTVLGGSLCIVLAMTIGRAAMRLRRGSE